MTFRAEALSVDVLFASIVSPLLIIDTEGRIQAVNPAAAEFFGEAITGKNYRELFGFVGRDPIAEGLQSGAAQHRVEAYGAGGRLWGLTISPYHSGDRGAIVGCRDLTEMRKMEKALADAERQAIIGRLASTVAHEINNPLGAMKAHLRVLSRSHAEDSPERQSAEIIAAQVDRIARTIRLLLGFSRQRLAPQGGVSPGEIIANVVELFAEGYAERGIRIETPIPENLPELSAETEELQEVFVNLLENARDILPVGSRLEIRARTEDGAAVFSVEDDGPGIGADPEKLFEPFYTTRASGTGLGLTIARRICESLGGGLTASNRSPRGAVFTIRIPLRK